MDNAEVFQFAAVGQWSNALFILAWVAVLIFDAFYLMYAFRIIKKVKRGSRQRAEWKTARNTIVYLVFLMFIECLGRMIAGPPNSDEDRVKPDLDTRKSKGATIGLYLSIVLLWSGIVSFVTFTEQPLRLAVSPESVTLLYRLPWRDRSIPINRITGVNLVRYQDTRNLNTRLYYNLLIFHDGKETCIPGGSQDPYESQMKSAYGAILTQLRYKQNPTPVAKATASSST